MSGTNQHKWEKTFHPGIKNVTLTLRGDKTLTTFINRVTHESSENIIGISKKPSISPGSVSVSPSGFIDMFDTADRPAEASAVGVYAVTDTYACKGFKNAPGKRIPKAGAYAGAGVGRARAAVSVLEAEAKGPNASAGAVAKIYRAEAMARAEVGSVSASAGPIKATLGLGVDTGVKVGVDGVEAKILGTGIRLGPNPSISLLGSELSCVIS
ncbi:uncharacterized protein LOC495244 isoform X1 [Xenopus laevis]|uniref:Uncharacterized protein LOC495244 isoform X1 n=1 Tax=Xenopus laevis TaxID=8355 RepID=A0A8J1LWL2_XENLA|nr:uncharacterized protein LOC495244 isoform X1 [Xenopus laevis]OCT58309.1 hypothetical protein XELAEV_18002247mg [Xenopus laevis]